MEHKELSSVKVFDVGSGKLKELAILSEKQIEFWVPNEWSGSHKIGSNEGTTKVEALLLGSSGERGRMIHLIGKEPTNIDGVSREVESPTVKFAECWLALRSVGLPVVQHLFVADSQRVYMTDFTALGGTLYDRLMVYRIPNLESFPEDNHFLKLDLKEVEEDARRIALSAARSRIGLPWDDPLSLLIRTNGDWSLHMVDFGWSRLNTTAEEGLLLASNNAKAMEFIKWLGRIREFKLQETL